MNYVNYEDFKKMDMRLGLIKFVEPVEGTDKLLRFEIDFGATEVTLSLTGGPDESSESLKETEIPFGKEEYAGRDVRQIVSGIREFFPEYEELVGKYSLYILNLEPREIRGVMSHGMLMAVDDLESKPIFLGPQGEVKPGARVR